MAASSRRERITIYGGAVQHWQETAARLEADADEFEGRAAPPPRLVERTVYVPCKPSHASIALKRAVRERREDTESQPLTERLLGRPARRFHW